ncbi:extracellular solute-binding protein [Cellulomonas sp. APG4]|uniref:extracellular solute-binding protein n=1 Tax=Cellulomonas sp. APG4 TaxID=1538656 RepID=UPI00137A0D3D|nr:extracellular solute-binding protein [Cellulomonas sp. APG4]NCT91011.1 extracellular solute-binding protein [Cellulomonas sp. APG4]
MRTHLRALTAVTTVTAVAALAACSAETTDDAAEPSQDSAAATIEGPVISYNSPTEWANWGAVLEAFTAETGIEAPSDPKNSGQSIAALEAEAAAPVADTAYYGVVFGYQASDKGLVQAYEPEGVDEVPDALKDPDGEWFAVHQGAIAFLVNTDELGDLPVPTTWEDLTDPMYEGMVGYLDPTQAAVGYSVLTAANLALGGDLDDFGPGLEWAAKMKANGVVNPVQTATASVQQGEIPILIDADFNGHTLTAAGDPIEVVYPEDGSLAIPYVMSLVADAPHEEAGKAFLDYVLSDEAQALFAESYLKPIRDVEVDPQIAEVFPDDYDSLVATPDFAQMQQVQEDVMARYQAEILG